MEKNVQAILLAPWKNHPFSTERKEPPTKTQPRKKNLTSYTCSVDVENPLQLKAKTSRPGTGQVKKVNVWKRSHRGLPSFPQYWAGPSRCYRNLVCFSHTFWGHPQEPVLLVDSKCIWLSGILLSCIAPVRSPETHTHHCSEEGRSPARCFQLAATSPPL